MPFIDITREFDAPVSAVFEAHSNPELVKAWLGPNGYEMDIEEYEFVSGGRYKYTHRTPEGDEFRFNGVFHVVRKNEFSIQTFEYEGFPDVVSIESMTFEVVGNGRTRLSGHAVYPSLEARDGMIESNMEVGVVEGFERLDKIVAQL